MGQEIGDVRARRVRGSGSRVVACEAGEGWLWGAPRGHAQCGGRERATRAGRAGGAEARLEEVLHGTGKWDQQRRGWDRQRLVARVACGGLLWGACLGPWCVGGAVGGANRVGWRVLCEAKRGAGRLWEPCFGRV